MTPLVLITGPFRSGTSAVAQGVHRLGFPAAMTIVAPQPPKWHSDWEDVIATRTLVNILLSDDPFSMFDLWFPKYLESRRVHTELTAAMTPWKPDGFAIKSPMYAPFVKQIMAECERIEKPVKTIVCHRPKAARDQSLFATHRNGTDATKSNILKISELCESAIPLIEHGSDVLDVSFDLLMLSKVSEVQKIASFLGVHSGDASDAVECCRESEQCHCSSSVG